MISLMRTIFDRDPSAYSKWHVVEIFFYPGLHAIFFHRVVQFLDHKSIPVLPRIVSFWARLLTGIDIHPKAQIGKNCFIDHGMGVVIGETAEIGNNVLIYQGVTLGIRSPVNNPKGSKRHPTIGNNVILCAGCKVLGPVTISDNSIIGANVVIDTDVPENTKVIQKCGYIIKQRKNFEKEDKPINNETIPVISVPVSTDSIDKIYK